MKFPDIFSSTPSGVLRVTAPAEGSVVPTDADTILSIALDIGEELLRCGGEVHRVEDTVTRICLAYGAVSVEVFAITSLIIGEVKMPDGTEVAHTRRVIGAYNHLARLEACNALSRAVCAHPISEEEVERRLSEIRHYRPVPEWMRYPAAVLTTGGLSIFFGGNLHDGFAAATIGLVMTALSRSNPRRINSFLRTLISCLAAGLLAVLSVYVGIGEHIDKIIIGTIMLEIPGLVFGNALRDMLGGDTLAGSMRLIQAILQTLIIAIGYMAALVVGGLLGGVL